MEVKFSLSKKLFIGFGLVIGLFIILSTVTFVILTQNDAINRRLSEQNTPSVNRLVELQNLVSESKLLIKNWVYIDKLSDTPDKKRLEELHTTLYPNVVSEIRPLIENWNTADRELFNEVNSKVTEELFRDHKHVMTQLNSFDSYNDFLILMDVEGMVDAGGSIITTTDQVLEQLEELITNQQNETALAYQQIESSTSFFRIFIIIGGILVVVFGLVISFYITSTIKRSVNTASEAISKLADGNLMVDFEITGNDEIAKLLFDLRAMIGRLRDIVNSIVEGSGEIATASMELNGIAQGILGGASTQASNAEEVSSSMEEMVANIQQNTENSNNTNKISNKLAVDIEKIGAESEKSMDSIKKISDKINIVNDIAFQTNLLALNAAVEAARAGEHGKGFAVVAAEVRKLAERSKVAADEILKLSKESVTNTESSVELIREIIPEIKRTSVLIQEITAGSIEQNNGAEQINHAIQQLNNVTQQNAANADVLVTSSEKMNSEAEKLKQLISFFKTEKGTSAFAAKKMVAPVKPNTQARPQPKPQVKPQPPKNVEVKAKEETTKPKLKTVPPKQTPQPSKGKGGVKLNLGGNINPKDDDGYERF